MARRAWMVMMLAVVVVGCGGKRRAGTSRDAAEAAAIVDAEPAGATTASTLPAAREAGVPPAPVTAWKPVALKAKDLPTGAGFGSAVAADGDVIVVGAPGAPFVRDVAGSAHVFARVNGVWQLAGRLKPPRVHAGFGEAVAVAGDRIAVASHDGTVEVFERAGKAWKPAATLTLPRAGDVEYSPALALDGDTLAVGLSDYMNSGKAEGRVVVYGRDATGAWRERALLAASDAAARTARDEHPNFGWAVALDGDTLTVTARQAKCAGGTDMCGAVYLFQRAGDTWTEALALPKPELKRWAMLGVDLASDDGDQALFCDGELRAWMLRRGPAGWAETGTLELPDGARDDQHGHHLALHRGRAVISDYTTGGTAMPPVIAGTNEIDTAAMAAQRGRTGGALHLFARTTDGWAYDTTLRWPDDVVGSELGSAVAFANDTIVAGAPLAGAAGAAVVWSP